MFAPIFLQLLEYIDADQLPTYLGGECRKCGGNCLPFAEDAIAEAMADSAVVHESEKSEMESEVWCMCKNHTNRLLSE